ncbi:MAG: hypothetical protein HYZ22_07130 [Chloroflexi bacterium]|nr:hypothetical protein [Chloroflexota bacterium]
MNRKTISMRVLIVLSVIIISTACDLGGTFTSDASMTATALDIQQTVTALDATAQANSAIQTQMSLPTSTPLATETPVATPGPLVIHDDFSTDSGRWEECGLCEIKNGYMQMGPYPSSQSAEGYLAICSDCGIAQDYKMGVDVTFVDGYSDRGYGLVLYEIDGSYIDVEVTTWQVYGSWIYDKDSNGWGTLMPGDPWKSHGALSPGMATNRIDVEVETKDGENIITVYINKERVNTLTTPVIAGRVGLVVGLHTLGVKFDNFYFEGYPAEILPGISPNFNG